jgi:DNA repair protein RecO (recombination protein O)
VKPTRRVALEPAYLLHHRAWRDTSRVVELLTRDRGRVSLFAKGARRAGSAWRAVLQPFAPLLVSWSGPGDGGTLTGAEFSAGPQGVPPPRLLSGFYLNELLLKLLSPEDPHPEVFESYAAAIAELAGPRTPAGETPDASAVLAQREARTLRLFEKRLLDALGIGLDYAHLAGGGERLDPDAYYHVRPQHGVVGVAARPAGRQGAAAAVGDYRGAHLLSLAAEELADAGALAAARQLLREALAAPLDGREIASRGVARALKAHGAGRGRLARGSEGESSQ